MKKSKLTKILLGSLIGTMGVGAIVGVSTGLGLNNNKRLTTSQNVNNNGLGFDNSKWDAKDAYSFSLKSKTNVEKSSNEYVLSIDGNTKKEGVIFLIDKDNNQTNELSFAPGETIKIGIQLNEGYEKYTARELKIFGKNKNIFVPTLKVEGETNVFKAEMPKYENTLDKETNESWFYDENTVVQILPSFIQESIGANDSKVEWEHGAFYNTLNGYVYELKADTTWTDATQKIYETFNNEDITNPIDVYFYLNGFNLTFNVDSINLDVPSGWALHFYNNKFDKKAENGKYGEIFIDESKQAILPISGSVTMGSSVKFKLVHYTIGVKFINFSDKSWIGYVDNDPEVRLGGR